MKIVDYLGRRLGFGRRRPAERRRAAAAESGEQPVRILFAVDSLAPSSTSRALLLLLEQLDRRRFVATVAVRAEARSSLATQLERLEVPVLPLGSRFEASRAAELALLCTWGLAPAREDLASLDLPWLHVAGESLAWLDGESSRRLAQVLHEADAVVATSPVSAECARRRFRVPAARLQMLPAGVSPVAPVSEAARGEARAALGIAQQARVFLSVGDFRASTGHRLAIEALGRFEDGTTPTELVCAGDVVEADYLEACRLSARRLGREVRFVPFDDADASPIARLCAAADFFVQPLGIDGLRAEALAALSAGVPLVAPDTVDARELLGEKGCAVLFREPADWPRSGAKAWGRLEADPAAASSALASAMRAAARSPGPLAQAAASGRELVEQGHGSDAVARCFEGAFFALARPVR